MNETDKPEGTSEVQPTLGPGRFHGNKSAPRKLEKLVISLLYYLKQGSTNCFKELSVKGQVIHVFGFAK